MKIVNKKRFITFIAIFIFLLIAVFYVTKASTNEKDINVIDTYYVEAGDTLWSICSKYRPQHMDIREYVYLTAKYNNINNCIIYPQQEIQIIEINEVR